MHWGRGARRRTSLVLGSLGVALGTLGLAACSSGAGSGSDAMVRTERAPLREDAPWPMHPIDSRFRGANALFRADVDGDGRDDYVTNYEFDQRFVVEFAPSDPADVTSPWPTMTWFCPSPDATAAACDTESAMLADLDGDGNLDIVGPQGGHPDRVIDGDQPGVRVLWGPDRARVRDPEAWEDAGRFPATVEAGHYLWALPQDVNDDGAVDVMVGGREYFGNGRIGGIAWLEAPANQSARRDLSAWRLHAIDPQTAGGHGFVLTDLDGDGDPDIVDANADFDTPENAEAVYWYRNPGPDSPDLTQPWPRTELLRDPGFYGKPQIAVADMNDDGRDDLVTETIDDYLFFLRRPGDAVDFDLVRVPKPDEIHWASRGLRIADMNDDGRPDLVGMLTHDDGVLPVGKASVYWLSFDGGRLSADDLRVHAIKWSPGRVSDTTLFGEKWDQVDIRDIDGDGDPDIVANDEEWMQEPDGEFGLYSARTEGETVAVVWFENTLGEEPPHCTEGDGGCLLEGERPAEYLEGTWIERNTVPDASGGAYLQAFNGADPTQCPTTPGPDESARDCPHRPDRALRPRDSDGVRYTADLEGGRYDVWVRLYAPVRFGNGLGSASSDSAYLSVDGGDPVVVGDAGVDPGSWTWIKSADELRLYEGTHELTLQVRERGLALDQLVLLPAGSPPPPDPA